jgi:hypothetical protein
MKQPVHLTRIWNSAMALHRDERGAGESALEKILLLAFIALPLLSLMMFYKDKVGEFIKKIWTDVTGSGPSKMTG